MSKPVLTPMPPLVLMTEMSPFGHVTAKPSRDLPWQSPVERLNDALRHDITLLHQLLPALQALDEAVALDDSNVSPNATAYKLKEALATYRAARAQE